MSLAASPDDGYDHVARLPVLGVETTFVTNSADVLRLVRETYGRWAGWSDAPGFVSGPGTRVEIVVAPASEPGPTLPREASGSGAGRGGPPRSGAAPAAGGRGRLPTLRIRVRGGRGTADPVRGVSRARVDPELVARPDVFVEGLLEPLTLFLAGARDRQPVHAAAVARDDTAILLAGPSGSGKSTLAYGAWREGFRVLADEPSYVQLRPRLRVWGRRSRLHLTPEAREHFPELAGVEPRALPGGKRKIVVEADGRGPPYAERAGLCIVSPGAGTRPRLEPLSVEEAVGRLSSELDPGYRLFADTIGERVEAVARGGAWVLHRTGDPGAAIPLLDQAVAWVRDRS